MCRDWCVEVGVQKLALTNVECEEYPKDPYQY